MMPSGAGGGLGLGKLLSKGPAAPAPAADDGGMADGGLDIAIGDLMRALERKDQAGATAAFKAAMLACQSTMTDDYDKDGD